MRGARFPGLGSKASDFQFWPNMLSRRPSHRPGLLGNPAIAPPGHAPAILLETSGYILLETGGRILLE
jgi:hypothetical protein